MNSAAGNARIKEEVGHVRGLVCESQKALSSIVKAVSQLQEQVAMLNDNMEQWVRAQLSGPNKRTFLLEERRTGSSKVRDRASRTRKLVNRHDKENNLNPYV
ncbi:unnamed protein product [Dibothriocephalus latus]|uniref:Uncharacterized protein n=1 Tax=Dibothriocephalus latus TaxID=60516 RepID=A0A3P7P062_DIBLA|nr:unnamed protein product [Dibothriocephalus latus]